MQRIFPERCGRCSGGLTLWRFFCIALPFFSFRRPRVSPKPLFFRIASAHRTPPQRFCRFSPGLFSKRPTARTHLRPPGRAAATVSMTPLRAARFLFAPHCACPFRRLAFLHIFALIQPLDLFRCTRRNPRPAPERAGRRTRVVQAADAPALPPRRAGVPSAR